MDSMCRLEDGPDQVVLLGVVSRIEIADPEGRSCAFVFALGIRKRGIERMPLIERQVRDPTIAARTAVLHERHSGEMKNCLHAHPSRE
jgi:hypothetical protein